MLIVGYQTLNGDLFEELKSLFESTTWPFDRSFSHGLPQQAFSKEDGRASETSGMDKTTGPRTQGSLPGQDASCTNLEIDEEDAWRITPKGTRARIVAGASSVRGH